MKWAITKMELKDLGKGMSPKEIQAIFSVYDSLSTNDPTPTPSKAKKNGTQAFGLRAKPGKGEKGFSKTTFQKWTFHRNLPKMSLKARRKYEVFCGGFLYFYDHQLLSHRNGKEIGKGKGYLYDLQNDHQLNVAPILDYFRGKLNAGLLGHEMWFNWEKDAKDSKRWQVTIYLNPPPGNPDPPSTPPPPPPENSFA